MDRLPAQASAGQYDPGPNNGASSPDGRSQSPNEVSSATPKSAEQPRQKRKKARRACLACQRAHLTCGDERPCHRCVKRGLEADCHDGMRKKAKYLHDAPNEALMPGAEQNFISSNDQQGSPIDRQSNIADTSSSAQQNRHMPTDQNIGFTSYGQDMTGSPEMTQQFQPPLAFNPYNSQTSPLQSRMPAQQQIPTSMQPLLDNATFGTPMFDPSDPIFNFDVSGMNFNSNYGAMELGMLNQMSSNANGTLLHRNSTSVQESPSIRSPSYVGDSPEETNYLINPRYSIQDWQDPQSAAGQASDRWVSLQNSRGPFPQQNNFVDPSFGYNLNQIPSIVSGTSPTSANADHFQLYDKQLLNSSSSNVPQHPPPTRRRQSQARAQQRQTDSTQRGQDGPSAAISKKLEHIPSQAVGEKPARNPSSIYSSVKKPHAYTAGFHALTVMLLRRFPSQKRLRIAKALASIRPSFISCMRTLTNEDLIFMEKCFQRQLLEYQDFIGACGTPTIVCRRTGEVAYAAKEFCALTGWSDSILLGLEANFNINKNYAEGSQSGTMSSSSRGGMNTPLMPTENIAPDADRPQPVFLPELLDDDSVVEFYEDFAKLAFADSKGSSCKRCKLIKYRTKDHAFARKGLYVDESGSHEANIRKATKLAGAKLNKSHPRPDMSALGDDSDIYRLGEKEGKIDCIYCWTVKRDVFEVPMMIVLNFLPIL